MRKPTEKDPKILIALGDRLAKAKQELPPDGYDAFKRREPELQHETKPGRLVVDKDQRLRRLAAMPVIRDNIDKLPRGWGVLRELAKLGEATLRCLFERGAIGPSTTREDLDRQRTGQKKANVAERHRGDFDRRKRRRRA